MRNFIDLVEGVLTRPLLEVVLVTPADFAIQAQLGDLQSESAKQWFLTNFKNWLVKNQADLHHLTYLPPRADAKQEKAFQFNDLWEVRISTRTQTMIHHLVDFFNANPDLKRLERMSVETANQAADLWVQRMNAKAKREPDDPKQVKVLMSYPNGFTMVGANALSKEGARMGHCVGGYCSQVTSGETRIFSLRDGHNDPHATIELITHGHFIRQIKGSQNRAPVQRYWAMIREFLESLAVDIKGDYQNIGLLRISDDVGGELTLTQDQFRDIIHDPNDERGQRILNTDQRWMDADTALGLFVALYGTPRLTDAVVSQAFHSMPDHAVQTVAAQGNLFTPEQLRIAFIQIAPLEMNMNKELMRVTKPDAAIVKDVIRETTPEQVGGYRHGQGNDPFVLALAQEMPLVYSELLNTDQQFLATELQTRSARSAAPFYIFAGTDKLTPAMVYNAFAFTAADAMKRIERTSLVLDKLQTVEAFDGLLRSSYRDITSEIRNLLDRLMAYTKPDKTILQAVMNDMHSSAGSMALLTAARKHVPEQVDKEMIETSIMVIGEDRVYQNYFESEPHPGAKMQQKVFEDKTPMMRYVQVIDPSIWPLVYEKLRPEKVDPIKIVRTPKYDKKRQPIYKINNSGYKVHDHYERKEKKDPKEIAAETKQHRDEAIKTFTTDLDPLLREPAQKIEEPLLDSNPKMIAGKYAFDKMGKSALFSLMIVHLNRAADVAAIQVDNGWGRRGFDSRRFAELAKTMRVQEIAKLILSDYHPEDRFGIFLSSAPERTGELLQYMFSGRMKPKDAYGGQIKLPWDKFKMALDKTNAFTALASVWESKASDGVKDHFATAVLKRFKPSPANLLAMLQKAKNGHVTHSILRKTKKPTPEIIDWVVANDPDAVIDDIALDGIGDASLAKIFATAPKLATALADRDLRGWGTSGRSRYSGYEFHTKIDRTSNAYHRYEMAAKTAKKEQAFAAYTHRAELDDTHETHDEATITKHLNDYDIRTLASLAKRNQKLIPVYFNTFDPNKMAVLIKQDILRGEWDYDRQVAKPASSSLDGIDPDKIQQVVKVIGDKKEGYSHGVASFVEAVINKNMPMDDAFIIDLIKCGEGSHGGTRPLYAKLTTDEAKNWVADQNMHNVENIKVPTPYIVERLFDLYGTPKKNEIERDGIPYFFKSIVEKWFGIGYSFENKFTPNPVAAKLIKDEAAKRGGKAVEIARKMFQILVARKKATELAKASASKQIDAGDDDA